VRQDAGPERQRAATAEALDELTLFVIRQMAVLREISFSAVATLSTLSSSGPCRITHLAELEKTSQPSITAMVSRLERQGLVARQDDPSDGRIVLVSITEAGRDMLRRRRASRLAFLSSLIAGLDPAEQRALAAAAPALRRMTEPAAAPAALAAAKQAAGGKTAAAPGEATTAKSQTAVTQEAPVRRKAPVAGKAAGT
jgi:DNA-binding MarR family transcriptional regulator